MATKKDDTAPEPVAVEGLETRGGKVVAVPPEPEVTPPPAQPTPDEAAKVPANQETVANIGQLRVKTAAEHRMEAETVSKEANLLRPAKEAHADAARISIVATQGTEFAFGDLKGIDAEGAGNLARARLLFDWRDGQGVFHERGKELDLPRNEAAKLIEQGLAERVNPPEADLVETAVAQAQIDVLSRQK